MVSTYCIEYSNFASDRFGADGHYTRQDLLDEGGLCQQGGSHVALYRVVLGAAHVYIYSWNI